MPNYLIHLGHDTTAHTLAWAIYEISTHPGIDFRDGTVTPDRSGKEAVARD
jgi:cytochrome P450